MHPIFIGPDLQLFLTLSITLVLLFSVAVTFQIEEWGVNSEDQIILFMSWVFRESLRQGRNYWSCGCSSSSWGSIEKMPWPNLHMFVPTCTWPLCNAVQNPKGGQFLAQLSSHTAKERKMYVEDLPEYRSRSLAESSLWRIRYVASTNTSVKLKVLWRSLCNEKRTAVSYFLLCCYNSVQQTFLKLNSEFIAHKIIFFLFDAERCVL